MTVQERLRGATLREVRPGSREKIPSIQGQGRRREELPCVRGQGRRPGGATHAPKPKASAGGREELPHTPTPEARGSGWEDQPHVQGAVDVWAQEGLEELSHVEDQEGLR